MTTSRSYQSPLREAQAALTRERILMAAKDYLENKDIETLSLRQIAELSGVSAPTVYAQEKRLDPLVVSYASVSGSRAPLWIAKEMGLFEKYGLDGRPIYVPAGYPSVSALISGDVQFIATGGSVVAAAAARGAQVVMVATLGSIAYKLMAHPSISTIEGLRGKVIGGLRPGT